MSSDITWLTWRSFVPTSNADRAILVPPPVLIVSFWFGFLRIIKSDLGLY